MSLTPLQLAGIHCPACHQGYINSLVPRCLSRCGRAQAGWSLRADRRAAAALNRSGYQLLLRRRYWGSFEMLNQP